jgi:hypothetical protein
MADYLFAFTHATRPMDFARASLHYLTRRYAAADRLTHVPPLASLSRETAAPATGKVTLWSWNSEQDSAPRLVEVLQRPHTTQHAIVDAGELVVCGTSCLEIFPLVGDKAAPRQVITHPWFAGGHTVFVDADGNYVVSCSAPDALLVFDRAGGLVRTHRVPDDLYGRNYLLGSDDDLREHYVSNDLQLTHINCGFPTPRGLLCSMLIPGAIGLFTPEGSFREITRGFTGCHAAKWNPHDDSLYFADSCNGNVVELTWEGRIRERSRLNSVWMQDVVLFQPGLYLAALSDQNLFTLWNAREGQAVWSVSGEAFGVTTQFCSWAELPAGRHSNIEGSAAAEGARIRAPRGRGRSQHTNEAFCADALAGFVTGSSKPDLPALQNWLAHVPGREIFSDNQWFQILAISSHFNPDLILELGSFAGRSTSALAGAIALQSTPATMLSTVVQATWDRICATPERPSLLSIGFSAVQTDEASRTGLPSWDARVAAAERVLVFCGDLDNGNCQYLLSTLLPALRDREHLVILPGISDVRHSAPLRYGEGGGGYLALGNAISNNVGFVDLVDFVSRNQLTLYSADAAFAALFNRDADRYNLIKSELSPSFSENSHWRWLTLNERSTPGLFPTTT